MKRPISAALTVVCVGLLLPELSGCGLILGGGTRQDIQVQASPDGAKVTTTPPTGDHTAPTTLNLERKTNYTLTFAKDGYSSATYQIASHVRGGIVVADVLLTGLIGVIVDGATGAWSKLSPETATVSLTKVAMVPGPDTITVGIRVGRTRDGSRVEIQPSQPGVAVEVAPVKKQ